jgi:uncharacterized protein YdhG (YjbR/CyaY superfamily)
MKNYNAKDVSAYIASAEKEAQPKLKELRALVKTTLPKTEERISYGMPFYKYHGFVAGFMTFKTYVSIGFTPIFPNQEERALLEKNGYKTGSRTIQIKFDQKIPAASLKRILKAKAKKNEAEDKKN